LPTTWPTMPSADFCCTFKKNRSLFSRESTTCNRSPVVSSIAFSAPPPDLPALAFDGYGLCCSLPTRPRVLASYPVLVHRRTPLLHASFRPHLAMTPLRFANPSPPSGWIGDLHPINYRTCTAHNDRVWKAWKAKRAAFHPSHTLWKSLRDYHIPTASTAGISQDAKQRETESNAFGPQRGCNGGLRSKV
jgi:hypothetical protein